MPLRSQTLIISGAHRSGTSLCADLLQQAGVHVGERLLGPAAGNRHGHFEDHDFFALHERALRRQGRDFLLEAVDGLGGFDAEETAEAERLIAARSHRPLWGWKDPRTALFLAEWDRLVPDARWFFVYRHPLDVVLSLLRRATDLQIAADPMRGVRVWEAYNGAILAFVRRHGERCVLLPLSAVVADEHAAIAAAAARLALPLDAGRIGRHVAADLHHGALDGEAAATFAAIVPSAARLLVDLDAAATVPPVAAAPRRGEASSPRVPELADLLARLDPAAVRASQMALVGYHRDLAAEYEAALQRRLIALRDLERRLTDEAAERDAAETHVERLAAHVRELEAHNDALNAALASSPLRRAVRVVRRVARELAGERPVPPPARPTPSGSEPIVLFVSHDAHRHGAQLLLLHLLRWLRAHTDLRFEILLKSGGELTADFEALAPTHHWPRDADALAHRPNVRLLYANTVTNGDVLAGLAPLGCPVLTHVHELEHWIRHHVPPANLREVVQRTARWVAVSERVREVLIESVGVAPDAIDLVYEFLGPEALRPVDPATSARLRRDLGIPPTAWVVGGSGTMDWRKGTDLFVQLAATTRRRSPSRPVHFLWLGGARDGDAFAKLMHEARVAGVGDRVHFVGAVADPIAYTACFDVFALVSREDPFPLVVLEAAAQRVPVVCFADAGGAPELVDGTCGWVVPYLDVEAMAARVVQLLEAPEERRAFGERGAARVRAEHTVEVAGPRLVAIVEALAASHPAARAVR